MKTKLTLLPLIGVNLLLNSGCEKVVEESVVEESVVEESVVEESKLNFRNGRFYPVNSDTPYSGKIVKYYENGQLVVTGDYKDGLRDGLYKSYYPNGQTLTTGNYKEGLQEGLHESYHFNGQISETERYKNGKRNGIIKSYHESGQLHFEKIYVSGEYKHTIVRYDYNGDEILYFHYNSSDEFISISDDSEVVIRYGDRIIKRGESIKTGDQKEGQDLVYEFLRSSNLEPFTGVLVSDIGRITKFKYPVINGIRNGLQEKYDHGSLVHSINYVDGKKHGLEKRYSDDGYILESSFNWVDGEKVD